jgi:hypothetical protein
MDQRSDVALRRGVVSPITVKALALLTSRLTGRGDRFLLRRTPS